MGRFDGVLLASDFDNTLIYTEEALRSGRPVPPLSAGNRAALESFMAQGGRFTVATGRALPAFERLAPLVPMNAPCVVCNGAAIYDFKKSEYLETALLPAQSRERGQEVLDAFPRVGVEAYHLDSVIHAVQVNHIIRAHEHLTGVRVRALPRLTEAPLPLSKLLFESEHRDLVQAEEFIRSRDWAAEYELIYSGKTLLELTAKGADKGGMLCRLAAHLGIAPEHVYAVGDERNDLTMLAWASQGFAPANCVPDVAHCGARLVCDARGDALAEVIAALEERYS